MTMQEVLIFRRGLLKDLPFQLSKAGANNYTLVSELGRERFIFGPGSACCQRERS